MELVHEAATGSCGWFDFVKNGSLNCCFIYSNILMMLRLKKVIFYGVMERYRLFMEAYEYFMVTDFHLLVSQTKCIIVLRAGL